MRNVPGFSANASLSDTSHHSRTNVKWERTQIDTVIPQMPKWFKCAVAIGAETAACLGGPNPACIGAAATAIRSVLRPTIG